MEQNGMNEGAMKKFVELVFEIAEEDDCEYCGEEGHKAKDCPLCVMIGGEA